MCSFLQTELSDIRVVLQKVSGSQIVRGVSSEMVVERIKIVLLKKIYYNTLTKDNMSLHK